MQMYNFNFWLKIYNSFCIIIIIQILEYQSDSNFLPLNLNGLMNFFYLICIQIKNKL